MRRPNPFQPTLTTPVERLTELGEILALGLVRLRARQSSELARAAGESSLACVASQSGDANPETEDA
jgi:hypothetical protein